MHLYSFQENNSPSSPLDNMLFALLVELIDTVNIVFVHFRKETVSFYLAQSVDL